MRTAPSGTISQSELIISPISSWRFDVAREEKLPRRKEEVPKKEIEEKRQVSHTN